MESVGPKPLPIGDPPFQDIIKYNQIYADKTEYIYQMLRSSRCCFLSRPRRFGKTLLVDTVEELFRGCRELFKGLWIDGSDYAFEKHPVLRFSMAYRQLVTEGDLVAKIKGNLLDMAKQEGVEISKTSFDDVLAELLRNICEKRGTEVVVLVDEYDSPVASHILDREFSEYNRRILRDFYWTLKDNVKYVHFAFVTGITRFTMTDLESGPNNFLDISLMPKFAGICGFTMRELDRLFEDRFEETLKSLKDKGSIGKDAGPEELKAKIEEWYDGYNWLGDESILNPYSILYFFLNMDFGEYWPFSGQPTILASLARERPLEFMMPPMDGYASKAIMKVDLGGIKAIPILFHTGYLTIDRKIIKGQEFNGETAATDMFTFKPPNHEVSDNFKFDIFKHAFDPEDKYFSDFATEISIALSKKDSKTTAKLFHKHLSAISYYQHVPSEVHYHSMLQSAFIASGIEVYGEVPSAGGRSDMVLFLKNHVRVVIELKYVKMYKDTDADASNGSVAAKDSGEGDMSAKELADALDRAERDIRDNDYPGPSRTPGCKVICLAVAIRGRTDVAVRFFDDPWAA